MNTPSGRSSMAYETISVAPIAGALGAEVSGVDLARKLPDATIAEIRQALLTHLVIFFRDQHLTPEQHLALGRRFGPLQVHDFVEAMPDYPEILEVSKEPEETRNFGGGWHTDVSYLERPSLGSLLYALEAPEYGGDTLFANQYLAYETLSDGMKRMLEGLRCTAPVARTASTPRAPRNTVPPRCASTSARRRTTRSSIQSFAPTARPAERHSTSTVPSRCASRT